MTRSVLGRPRLWLLGLLLATLPFALALGRLKIRTDGEALQPLGNPVVAATTRASARFDDPPSVVVLVEPRAGAAGVLDRPGLAFVQALTETLSTIPGVRADDVLSIATLPDVRASAGTLHLARFVEAPPADDSAATALRARILAERFHRGLLFAQDGRSAAIVVPLAPEAPRVESVHRVRARLRGLAAGDYTARLTGPVVAETLLGEQILADLARLTPLVVLVIATVLLLCLRQPVAALVVATGLLAVLVWTFGAMALFGVPLTLVTSVLPVLILAMAVNDQIHLIERVQHHRAGGATVADALRQALAEVGAPIARTSVTTALGFLAFTTTSVLTMRHFGIFAALGLLLAMAFTFTLVPALLMVLGLPVPRARAADERAPRGPERWAARRPGRAALVTVALVLVALAGLPALRIEDSWLDNFDPRSDLTQAARSFDRDYLGLYRLDVTLESDAPAFRGSAGLRLVDSVQAALAAFPEVAATRSVADLARAGLADLAPGRTLEGLSSAGVEQLFLALEMTGAPLGRLVVPDGGAARIQCFVRGADYSKARRLLARVDTLEARLAREGVRIAVSGDLAVATETVRATVTNQLRSVGVTLAGIAAVLALAFRSLPIAAALIAPAAATTVVVLGAMGALGIPLGVATSMFAALAEGEGVGFAIHVASRYFDLRRAHDHDEALQRTLGGVGRAVRINGLVVVAGCLVLCLSGLRPVRALGALLAAGIALSWLLSFLLLPALLRRLAHPRVAARAAAAMVALVLAALPCASAAQEARDDPEARRLMTAIERAQRARDRVFSMDVALEGRGYGSRRRILGVVRGEPRDTRLLYVVTAPTLQRGAALLIHDARDPAGQDRMWISLPGLAALRELDAGSLRLIVPGTGLTYDEARGWIAPDNYRFTVTARAPDAIALDAVPRTDSLSRLLGLSRRAIRADPRRRVLLSVTDYDRAGTLVRTYAATRFVTLGGVWYPARVETEHRLQRITTAIEYVYAPLPRPAPEALFLPDTTRNPADAMGGWIRRSGWDRQFPDSLATR